MKHIVCHLRVHTHAGKLWSSWRQRQSPAICKGIAIWSKGYDQHHPQRFQVTYCRAVSLWLCKMWWTPRRFEFVIIKFNILISISCTRVQTWMVRIKTFLGEAANRDMRFEEFSDIVKKRIEEPPPKKPLLQDFYDAKKVSQWRSGVSHGACTLHVRTIDSCTFSNAGLGERGGGRSQKMVPVKSSTRSLCDSI